MEELYKVITSQCKLTLCLQSGDELLVSGQTPPHTQPNRRRWSLKAIQAGDR